MQNLNSRATTGTRHALHLRPHYEASLGAATQAGSQASIAQLDDLAARAVAYSATDEGDERVKRDMVFSERNGNWELSAVLRAAHTRGLALRAAQEQTKQILSPRKIAPTLSLWDHTVREWSPEKPIWPKKEAVLDALKATKIPLEDEYIALKAYRSLFATAWQKCFYQTAKEFLIPPHNDDEGWAWRTSATETANRQISGATSIRPADLKNGMTVYNGFGMRTVDGVIAAGTAKLAREDGKIKELPIYQVRYTDGNIDKMVPSDTTFIRVPSMEKELPKVAPNKLGKGVIDFS